MKKTTYSQYGSVLGLCLAMNCLGAEPQEAEALKTEIAKLEAQLKAAKQKLAVVEEDDEVVSNSEPANFFGDDVPNADDTAREHPVQQVFIDPDEPEFRIGDLYIGGAMRVNYVLGDYLRDGGDGPERGGNGGNVELDIFRINLDYNKKNPGFTAKGEYRFLDGYHFAHTAWAGWRFEDDTILRVGLNRVPFGAGPYGTSHNWFFDQGYYVGLTDDMDLGISLTKKVGDWTLDAAYYGGAEPNFFGDSSDSARYSYDIVDNGSPYSHYSERHQINARAIRRIELGSEPGDHTLDLGGSLQAGLLDGDSAFANDSYQLAAAVHGKWRRGPWEVVGQVSAWDYAADYKDGTGLSDSLIGMGAYDFESPVASRGVLPAVGVSYTWETDHIGWLDSITFYNDFSVILKDGEDADGRDLNSSALNVLGMSFARGNWFIYCDWAYSNGNYFVGNESFTDFGANREQTWQSRFNINFGYYF